MKTIYIADDDPNTRNIIGSFLKNDGFFVEEFENGDDLFKRFLVRPADMAILDIMMHGTDGLAICSQIRSCSNMPIIIVSARDSELDRITGITIGSDDYLVKPFSPMELVVRVKSIFRRIDLNANKQEKTQLLYGNMVLDLDVRTCFSQGNEIALTPTEFSLVEYMFKYSARAISREELLKNIWRFDFGADTRATDDVLKRLRKKLLITNVKISSVWGFGFKLELEGNE